MLFLTLPYVQAQILVKMKAKEFEIRQYAGWLMKHILEQKEGRKTHTQVSTSVILGEHAITRLFPLSWSLLIHIRQSGPIALPASTWHYHEVLYNWLLLLHLYGSSLTVSPTGIACSSSLSFDSHWMLQAVSYLGVSHLLGMSIAHSFLRSSTCYKVPFSASISCQCN